MSDGKTYYTFPTLVVNQTADDEITWLREVVSRIPRRSNLASLFSEQLADWFSDQMREGKSGNLYDAYKANLEQVRQFEHDYRALKHNHALEIERIKAQHETDTSYLSDKIRELETGYRSVSDSFVAINNTHNRAADIIIQTKNVVAQIRVAIKNAWWSNQPLDVDVMRDIIKQFPEFDMSKPEEKA